MAPGKSENRVR